MLSLRSRLIALFALLTLLAGCGGGGGGGGSSSNAFTGIYKGTFSRGSDTILLIAISNDGTTEAVVSDETGVLVQGKGTTDTQGNIAVSMTGTPGNTNLTGAFTRAPDGQVTLDGGISGTVPITQTGNGSISSFAGKYKFQFVGSSTGTVNITVSETGKVYKRVGTQLTQIGTVSKGGSVTFTGESLLPPPANTIQATGTLFLTANSTGGSGTWKDTANQSIQGTWTAIPDAGDGEPIFTRISIIKSINGAGIVNILAASPNGHLAGFAGGTPAYWADPDATPYALNHAAGANISWPTGVNESGMVVGYSYATNGLAQSKAVYWPAGSSTPTELPYPEEYVSGIASGINSQGVIVGLVRKTNGSVRACIWPSPSGTPILPPQGDAVSISNAGIVFCQANNGFLSSIEAATMSTLFPPPGYGAMTLQAMGANGIITGTAELGGDGIRRPIAWLPPQLGPIALAFVEGFQEIVPYAAGPTGSYTGRGKTVGSNNYQAIYWKSATEIVLLDDVVASATVFFQGGQYILADGSVIAYGKDFDQVPLTAWLRP